MDVMVSFEFQRRVQQAWGNPVDVANVAIDEAFQHGRSLDHDDQVRDAIKIGVLAGQMEKLMPQEFITAFKKFLGEE